jgi:enoyl-CoA hydratase/carnithine racemase
VPLSLTTDSGQLSLGKGGVLAELRGAGLWVTLNRPQTLNALDADVVASLVEALEYAEVTPEIRAFVISGTQSTFSAGADLKFLSQAGLRVAQFLQSVGELFRRLESSPLPVIAAVNGIAVAGGLELVLCCDLVYATQSARFGDGHANYGLLPGGGGSVRLPRRIGATRAKHLLFTGELVGAEILASAGLINKVVPDDELLREVDLLVDSLARKSPLGLRRMKQLVNDGLDQSTSTALRLELLAGAAHSFSDDMKEGIAAFTEKRLPRFSGD